MRNLFQRPLVTGMALVILLLCGGGARADVLTWRTNDDRVTADVNSVPLARLLEGISKATGWRVYLESNTTFSVSAKFSDLRSGEALRHLLSDVNFALVPQTNGPARLYVFRSSRENATLLIHPNDLNPAAAGSAIPDELIVRLKPGANIDDLARRLNAKVIGRIDGLNAYRLKFGDAAAADAARAQLEEDSDVASVDSNFIVDPPPAVQKLDSAPLPPVQFKLNPPDGSGRVMVGLIDTAVQPLGNELDAFLAQTFSVAGDAKADPNAPTHGTSMFENILRAASSAAGGSSSMQVISVDVYGPNRTTSTFDVAAGIAQAVNHGATIINLSLGSPGDTSILHDIIQQAAQKGVPVFAAAGNDGSPELFYPAAYPEAVAVTAASGAGKLAGYANYGSFVDLMAPGSGIIYFGKTAYLVSGTSTATAYISGMTAGLADAKKLSPADAAKSIANTATFRFVAPK